MQNQTLPRISIIIGVLNMKEYLPRTLESVIRQNYPNLELIVMDGGSTDGTLDVIKQYQPFITYWKSEKDKGHCDACNKGIEIATGDLIELLNADDFLDEGLLHKVALLYNSKPHAKMITTGVHILQNETNHQSRITRQINDTNKLQITLHNMIFELPAINARFFHKDIFKQFGKFNPTLADGSYNMTNDREFLIKLALSDVQSEIIPDVFYNYLSHDHSLTFSMKNQFRTRHEHINLANHFLAAYHLPTAQQAIFKAWIAKDTIYLFLMYLLKKLPKQAFKNMKQGLKAYGYRWFCKLISVATTGVCKKAIKGISKS